MLTCLMVITLEGYLHEDAVWFHGYFFFSVYLFCLPGPELVFKYMTRAAACSIFILLQSTKSSKVFLAPVFLKTSGWSTHPQPHF